MTTDLEWWRKPRTVSVVVDNDSWILPHAKALVSALCAEGDDARLFRAYTDIGRGGVAFFLGCIGLAPKEVLERNRRNLVVHESDLPQGRGFSPLTWQILEGRDIIPVCLLEAAAGEPDSGPVVYRDEIRFDGSELNDEMRQAQGEMTVHLCRRFLSEPTPPVGGTQTGAASYHARRTPADSRLDVHKSLAEQFRLLRTVDNERYPAYFDWQGVRYELRISRAKDDAR